MSTSTPCGKPSAHKRFTNPMSHFSSRDGSTASKSLRAVTASGGGVIPAMRVGTTGRAAFDRLNPTGNASHTDAIAKSATNAYPIRVTFTLAMNNMSKDNCGKNRDYLGKRVVRAYE